MHYKVNTLKNVTELTPYSPRLIVDLYNFAHGTSYLPENLVYLQSAIRKLSAIGQLGFTGTEFGIMIYSLPSSEGD